MPWAIRTKKTRLNAWRLPHQTTAPLISRKRAHVSGCDLPMHVPHRAETKFFRPSGSQKNEKIFFNPENGSPASFSILNTNLSLRPAMGTSALNTARPPLCSPINQSIAYVSIRVGKNLRLDPRNYHRRRQTLRSPIKRGTTGICKFF